VQSQKRPRTEELSPARTEETAALVLGAADSPDLLRKGNEHWQFRCPVDPVVEHLNNAVVDFLHQ
jgi:hypothetical protein